MNPYLEKNKKLGKWTSLLITCVAYVVAYFVALIVFRSFSDWGSLYGIFIADLVATVVIFLVGFVLSNASLYDPYWSVIPMGLAIFWWSVSDYELSLDKQLILFVIYFWGIRLTLNWVRGWPGFIHEDWRYEMLREKHGRSYQWVNLFGIHLFPTVLVFLGMVPAYYVLSTSTSYHSILLWFAFVLGVTATLIELISDEQMRKWIKNGRTGGIMRFGLWKYSRHPNYFGEVLFWFSLWLFAMAIDIALWWTAIGWIAMLWLFLQISIPMMDERSLQRRAGFDEYMEESTSFWLWPPKKKDP